MFMGMNPVMLRIGTTACILLIAFLFIFFFLQNLDVFIEHRLLFRLRGPGQRFLHYLANYLTDKPVTLPWVHAIGEWAVVLFLRSPALVLVYSATNDARVMPIYPLDATSAIYLQ